MERARIARSRMAKRTTRRWLPANPYSLFARSGRGEIEHAAGGLLVARHQRVFREHLATLGVTRACERNGDHAPAVEELDRPHLRLQHQDVAWPHEAVGRGAGAAAHA